MFHLKAPCRNQPSYPKLVTDQSYRLRTVVQIVDETRADRK